MNNKEKKTMKKITLTLITAAMLLAFAGCSQNNSGSIDSSSQTSQATGTDTSKADDNADSTASDTSENTDSNTDVSAADIEKKIADAIGDNYLCDTDFEEDWFKNYYGFDMSQIDEYVAKQNSISAVNPDTVIVLKVKDGYADTAVDLLNTAYAQQVSYIRTYAFSVQKVMNARIFKNGNYVIYALAGASYEGEDSQEELKLAETEYAKIDAAVESVFGSVPENLAVVPEDDGSSNRGFFDVTFEGSDDYYDYSGTSDFNYDDMPVVGG